MCAFHLNAIASLILLMNPPAKKNTFLLSKLFSNSGSRFHPGQALGRSAMLAVAAFFLFSLPQPFQCTAAPALSEVANNCAANDEKLWRSCAKPPESLGARDLFAYALNLCESKQHPERLDRLFELAAEMQDRDPKSRSYGNFRWYRRDAKVLDGNAVDFCMRGGSLLWMQYREFIPEKARARLLEMLNLSTIGCLNHKVRESYSNIAIMNAGDLILLGETFGDAKATKEGYDRLDRVYQYARQAGFHEFDSPTYSSVDLDGLGMIEAYCHQERGRAQARALLELLWTDIAANWFEPSRRLAGAQSRSYDYLHGLGGIEVQLTLHDWLNEPLAKSRDVIFAAQSQWQPPAKLHALAQTFPRLVRQTWGIEPNQFRTHYLLPDITLSCTASSYGGWTDMPLTVDLPGDRKNSVRCYFIADGRDDPFGKKKIPQGPHQKALHLNPFWAAAQRETDALGLVVYRNKDISVNDAAFTLLSTFVLPLGANSIRIGDRPVHFTPAKPAREAVKPGDVISVRQGTAALALRIPWTRGVGGAPATIVLNYDGNNYGAVCLTVEHGGKPTAGIKNDQPIASAAFWVRIASGLTDEASFNTWLAKFTKAQATADDQANRVKIQVEGLAGPVSLDAPLTGTPAATLNPAPAPVVLEVDGTNLAPQILGNL